jgi:hypothetical protein
MLILIGEAITKRSVSDGRALTGCRVLEGVAARLSFVRPALRSWGDDPDLAAGGPKRTERGGRRDGQWEGEALTGRTSGSPTSR